jgi:hypothetical protein
LAKVCKLVKKWLGVRAAFKTEGLSKDLLWAVQTKPKVLVEADVDGWLLSTMSRVGVQAVGLSSHSLRVGCVSGLYALGAEVHFICIWMRWGSDAMVNVYVHAIKKTAELQSLLGLVVASRASLRG